MTDVPDLITWWSGVLDRVEQVARAAGGGVWHVDDESYAEAIYDADGTAVVAGGRWGGEASVFNETEDAVHIALHDPASVLANVAAARALLDECAFEFERAGEDRPEGDLAMFVLKTRAAAYAHFPGYRDEWRPA